MVVVVLSWIVRWPGLSEILALSFPKMEFWILCWRAEMEVSLCLAIAACFEAREGGQGALRVRCRAVESLVIPLFLELV